MENPIPVQFVVCDFHIYTIMHYICILYTDVVGKSQNETELVFGYEKYCNRKCVLSFGCSENWSMTVPCLCMACLCYNDLWKAYSGEVLKKTCMLMLMTGFCLYTHLIYYYCLDSTQYLQTVLQEK